jgi:hypothetical protein
MVKTSPFELAKIINQKEHGELTLNSQLCKIKMKGVVK